MTAIFLPLITAASLYATDYVMVSQEKAKLQRAVDGAALTTVRGLQFVREGAVARTAGSEEKDEQSDSTLTWIADSAVRTHMGDKGTLKTSATRTDKESVSVTAIYTVDTPLASLTGLDKIEISATAKAQLYGTQNICILALESREEPGINIEDAAKIKSGNCGIYSNSPSVSSINAIGSSAIEATFICASGGYTGGKSNVSTNVVTDCPELTDPLESRPIPKAPTTCDHNWLVFKANDTATLEPGHYCGGLIIEGDADVEMSPGMYFISGGMLVVQGNARLAGANVSIVMDDAMGSIFFNDNASVTLSASVDGPMAGIVVASRSLCDGGDCHYRVFEIKSAQVSSLLGTIYVPEDRFIINTTMPISEEAAFTIILSRTMQGQRSPTLVLNTDYEATDVPVPDGLLGSEGSRLVR